MSFITGRFSKISFITSIVLVLGWLISIQGFTSYRDAFGTPIGPDFLQFYTGATFFLENQRSSLYDLNLQIETESRCLHSKQEYLHPYIYPPVLAYGLQPLARFDYRLAFFLWTVVGAVIFWRASCWLSCGLTLGWFPVFAALSYGQNSFLSLGIIAGAAWLWVEKDRAFLAGLVLGLLSYKPQLLIGLLPGFLIFKEWKVIQGIVLAGVFFVLFSLGVIPQETAEYIRFAREKIPLLIAAPGFPLTQFFDSKGFFRLLFPQAGGVLLTLLSLGVGVSFLAIFKKWGSTVEVGNKRIRMAGIILLFPWINPYVLVYDWTVLLIAYGLLKRLSTAGDSELMKKGVAWIWVVSLISIPIASWMMNNFGFGIQFAPLFLGYFTVRFFLLKSHDHHF